MRVRPLLLGLLAVVLSCATLDPLPNDTCGNGVVDAFEDCDSFPAEQCGKPTEGARACRLACGVSAKDENGKDTGKMLTCPDGWGCSVDHVCREPQGTFQTPLAPVSAGVTNLLVGDFDRDGRTDLVGTGPRSLDNASRVRVHFFDDLGALAHIESLPSQFVSPVVTDIDRNGFDDIAFGLATTSPGALGVVGGLAERRFLPILFPSITIADTEAIPVSVEPTTELDLPNGGKSAILLFGRTAAGPLFSSLDAEVGVGGQPLKRDLPVGPEAVHGRLQSARLFDLDPKSTCSEVIAAVDAADGPSVYVVSPCTFVEGPNGTKVARWEGTKRGLNAFAVPKPLGKRGVLVADIDDDGHLDVIVDTTEGPYAALGNGTSLGPFTAPPDPRPMPLAVEDLNGDKIADYVFPQYIVFSHAEKSGAGDAGAGDAGADADAGTYDLAFVNAQGEWSDVVTGNFNGDAFMDVAAMRAGSPDLQLYAGNGAGGFTAYTVSTDNVVQALAKGDFDGDHVEDIAVSQASSTAGSSDLAIAYGRAFGPPEPARLIGRASQPKGLSGIKTASGVDDLGLFTYGEAKAGGIHPTSFTRLVGSGDRQTLAPLFFLDKDSKRPLKATPTASRFWFPVGLAAGAFTKAMHPELISYALGFTFNPKTGERATGFLTGVWSASADESVQGGLAEPKENVAIDQFLQIIDPNTFAVTIATATADVDNAADGLAEVVVVTNVPGGQDALIQVIHPAVAAGVPGGGMMIKGLQIAPGAQLSLLDVDGDGFRDAVGVFGPPSKSQVVAFLNDQKGSFVVPGIPLTIPPAPQGVTLDANARAFAAVTIGGAPVFGKGARTTALAVVTSRSLYLARLAADKKGFDVSPNAGGEAISGVAAGDFNGDGVEDIALADGGSVRMLLQLPARSRP